MVLKKLIAGYFFLFWGLPAFSQEVREIFFPVRLSGCEIGENRCKYGRDTTYLDNAILKLPPSYSPGGKPTRLVYMAHGAGGGVTGKEWFLNNFGLQELLLKNGYAVFDVNGGRVENMGGAFVVAAAYKAWQYIVENYNVYPKIIVGGFSMGGLSSANFIYQHSTLVLAHVMYSPVLDLYEQAWKVPWLKSTRKALAEVYQFEDLSGEVFDSCAIAGMNPIDRYTFHSRDKLIRLYPVPARIWHGTGDKIVAVQSSRRFYDAVKRAGGDIELTEIDSDDHGLSCGNTAMNHDLLNYIKRFE